MKTEYDWLQDRIRCIISELKSYAHEGAAINVIPECLPQMLELTDELRRRLFELRHLREKPKSSIP